MSPDRSAWSEDQPSLEAAGIVTVHWHPGRATMRLGDQVSVWQEDQPDRKTIGTVTLFSTNHDNECPVCGSIAVALGDSSPFAVSGRMGLAIDAEHGIMLLASRECDGSYTEIFSGIRYRIESVKNG